MQFSLRWNFPNTVSAIDGKHIAIQKPAGGGSFYYNYKHTHSIVLMTVAGPDYECIYADVGANGRCSDGGISSNSNLSKQIKENSLGITGPKKLTNSNSATPYVFLGDDAFALKTFLIKPYPQRGLTVEKCIYNYRHSRARRISENLFEIICNRWSLFRAPILLRPNSIECIVLATLVFHNLFRRSSSRSTYCPPSLTDMELPAGEFARGSWRSDGAPTQTCFNLSTSSNMLRNASLKVKEIRNIFTDYFVNEGQVQWQWQYC